MKKKKLTFNSLALGNLKHRKKRYTLMILGIVLSMVFSSSIIYFGFSIYTTSQEQRKAELGLYDKFFGVFNEKMYEAGKSRGAFEETGFGETLGLIFTDKEEKINGTPIAKLDETAKKLVNPILIEGSYPEKQGEIAIEQTTLLQLGITAKPGDKIKLKMQVQNGEDLLPKIKEKNFVLSGILKDKRSNILYSVDDKDVLPSAFVSEYEKVDLGGKANKIVYYKLTDDGWNIIYDVMAEYDGFTKEIGVYSEVGEFMSDQFSSLMFIGTIVVILLLASSVGIVNAFTSNLKERKKQIGMYRAVGATKRQIRKLFGREAVLLSVICTPISLLISYGAVKILVNNLFENAYFEPNIWVLLACGAFSIICVIAASFIPLVSASKISPMQAIRNIEATRKLKNKKVKSQKNFNVSKLIAKRNLVISKGKLVVVSLFLVITIIFSSYALSYLSFAKDDLYEQEYDYSLHLSRDSGYFAINYPKGNNGFTENHKQSVLMNENIKSAYGIKTANVNILVDEMTEYQRITDGDFTAPEKDEDLQNLDETNYQEVFNQGFSQEKLDIINLAEYDGNFINFEIVALDEELINQVDSVRAGEIDIAKLNSGEQVILLAPEKVYLVARTEEYGTFLDTYQHISHIEEAKKGYGENIRILAEKECDFKAGDLLDLSILYSEKSNEDYDITGETIVDKEDLEINTKQVEICAIANDTIPMFTFGGSEFSLVTTVEGMEHFFPRAKYKEIMFDLKGECNDEIDAEITDLLKSIVNCVDESDYMSNYEYNREQKETIKGLTFLVYAIVILLFTICGSIINNTIAANIKEDKKKIGTLRAVGANEKEISKSYILQLLSMFKWGFGIGFGGFALSYLIIVLTNKYTSLAEVLVFNPWITLLLGLILFAICSLSVYSKIRKETRNSIVENIREL
ncbi:MAG: ABC transporter permease [Clostridia bacterium]|nr:ABC transporter permease [Clostridia bacterium]